VIGLTRGWLRSQWDREAGYGCIAVGAACLTVTVVRICRSPGVLGQLSYLSSGAFLGLLLGVVGTTLLIAADLHDEWRKLERIEAALGTTGRLVPAGSSGQRSRRSPCGRCRSSSSSAAGRP
jgi:hypothetical protein